MCIYFSLWCVCMCHHTSDCCMWHLMCALHGYGPAVCWGTATSDPYQCSSMFFIWMFNPSSRPRRSPLILTVWPSPQPCCGSLTQHSMCYSSHVVRSCQKQPWQILLFCLWNDHVGLTLQTTIIIRSWLHCTCKICFVGTRCHNSKVGGRFICKVWNTTFFTTC